jgi:hypothetical protein
MRLLVFASLAGLFIVSLSHVSFCGVLPTPPIRRTGDTRLNPALANVTQNPTVVEYFNSVNVTALLANATEVSSVALFYQVDTADWEDVRMTNSSAQAFWGVIPQQGWNSHVQYYVNITNLAGYSVIEDNQSSYYRYVVVDTIEPVIRILRPFDGERFNDFVQWNLEFGDAGSGVGYFEIYLDNQVVAQGHANGISGGAAAAEGLHIIRVEVYDLAGNVAEELRSVTIENPTTNIPGFPVQAVAIALVAGLAVGLLVKHRRSKAVLGNE